MPGVTIRDYAASDLQAILNLNQEAWADPQAPEARGGMDAPDLHAIESVYQKDGAFLVAVDEGSIVGMVGLQRLAGGSFEMRRMRVKLSHQGRGIARALVEAVEEKALLLGARHLGLSTTLHQERARRLYEAMGYQPTHTTVLEDRHGRLEVVHYEKTL